MDAKNFFDSWWPHFAPGAPFSHSMCLRLGFTVMPPPPPRAIAFVYNTLSWSHVALQVRHRERTVNFINVLLYGFYLQLLLLRPPNRKSLLYNAVAVDPG
jgi:hypothetical protein